MIGVIVAMESELNAILSRMKEEKTETVGESLLHYGILGKTPVVVCLSGVGKCKAAMASTILCMKEKLDVLINVGVAGGLLPQQHVMDMVISSEVIQADYDTSPLDGESGIGLRFPVHKEVLARAEKIASELEIPYSVGAVATQDLFMEKEEDFRKLMQRFPQSACSEMEGGAVAQVAASFQVPFLVLRSLSDVVCHEGNSMEFATFCEKASQRAGEFIQKWCE